MHLCFPVCWGGDGETGEDVWIQMGVAQPQVQGIWVSQVFA